MSKLKSNLVYLTFAQAISYIFPLLTLPYLSHKLDPSDFGMLGVCQAIVQYFIIVTDYGFNITTTKEISINRNNKKKISKIFSTTLLAKIFLLFVSAIGLIISGWAVKSISGYELLLICCFVGVIGNTFYPLWLFQGTETMKIPVIMSSGAKLLLLL
ncbi:TPA: O141 family O-antigen flippase, partial [Escherichia coli]|nr:O141 family O-antigen flippase [Escherichia coli]